MGNPKSSLCHRVTDWLLNKCHSLAGTSLNPVSIERITHRISYARLIPRRIWNGRRVADGNKTHFFTLKHNKASALPRLYVCSAAKGHARLIWLLRPL